MRAHLLNYTSAMSPKEKKNKLSANILVTRQSFVALETNNLVTVARRKENMARAFNCVQYRYLCQIVNNCNRLITYHSHQPFDQNTENENKKVMIVLGVLIPFSILEAFFACRYLLKIILLSIPKLGISLNTLCHGGKKDYFNDICSVQMIKNNMLCC